MKAADGHAHSKGGLNMSQLTSMFISMGLITQGATLTRGELTDLLQTQLHELEDAQMAQALKQSADLAATSHERRELREAREREVAAEAHRIAWLNKADGKPAFDEQYHRDYVIAKGAATDLIQGHEFGNNTAKDLLAMRLVSKGFRDGTDNAIRSEFIRFYGNEIAAGTSIDDMIKSVTVRVATFFKELNGYTTTMYIPKGASWGLIKRIVERKLGPGKPIVYGKVPADDQPYLPGTGTTIHWIRNK